MESTLANQLLIAMPGMADPNFSSTVTLICEHNDEGALGIVINRPLDLTLGGLFEQLELDDADPGAAGAPVLMGGPVGPERRLCASRLRAPLRELVGCLERDLPDPVTRHHRRNGDRQRAEQVARRTRLCGLGGRDSSRMRCSPTPGLTFLQPRTSSSTCRFRTAGPPQRARSA